MVDNFAPTLSRNNPFIYWIYFVFDQLNPQQRAAVLYLDSPLLVIAGAGSGKTGVITEKIAYLIESAHYDAPNVCAVTFTNKAAREMLARNRARLKKRAHGLTIATFHRLGLMMLERDFAKANRRRGFSIFDQHDSLTLLRELCHNDDDAFLRRMQQQISAFKNANVLPEETASLMIDDETAAQAAKIYCAYCERLQAYNAVDFDDLLLLPTQLLKTDAAVRGFWQEKIRYLFVDEYQDTNNCQYALMQLIVGAGGALTAVGDDDQSIYAWRGAQVKNLQYLQEDYPQLHIIKLEQNYRCHHKILQAANTLIAHNPHLVEKRLWSQLERGDGVCVFAARNDEAEAERIASAIYQQKLRTQAAWQDFAVLYRSNFQARAIEQALRDVSIPYQISGGTSFYEHSEIRDLLAYLRLINNPEDDAAFLRICNVPKREIGTKTLTVLGEYAAKRQCCLFYAATELGLATLLSARAAMSVQQFCQWIEEKQKEAETALPSALLQTVIDEVAYREYIEANEAPAKAEKRWARVEELIAWLVRLEEEERYQSLAGLMRHVLLLDILEHQDKQKDGVQLMTLHAAKGLEFPYVYIAGVEEDLLPHHHCGESEEAIAEERRLLYVGMTRAKFQLTLSYAKQRRHGKNWEASTASRFLQELPEEGIDWQDGRRAIDEQALNEKREEMFSALRQMFEM